MSVRRWLCLPLYLAGVSFLLVEVAQADEALRDRVEQLRLQRAPAVSGVALASGEILADFYQRHGYRPAWGARPRVDQLLDLADNSRDEGLDPEDFHRREVSAMLGTRAPRDLRGPARIDADIVLSDSLLRLIHHLRYGKVDPQALDSKWGEADEPTPSALIEAMEKAVTSPSLAATVTRMTRQPFFYERLEKGLGTYRRIAAAGGWPAVPPGPALKPGMRDARVPVIRMRLAVTGDYRSGKPSDPRAYDRELKRGVVAFQERHSLASDGIIGPATLAAMNVPASQRVDQIRANLERMRWVLDALPTEFLLVDIAGQQIDLYRAGNAIWTSRVIVGRPERPTPTLRDRVEYLEFNPTWTVPPTILKKDILPEARRDPAYVRGKGLRVITRDGRTVAPEAVNWRSPPGPFPYTLRQDPGDDNALGKVKFMFPNRFSVYLHDTPTRNLFARPRRLFSSGCVRVDRPFDLATLVMNDPERWNQQTFDQIVESKRTRIVRLTRPLAIILAYWTTVAGADGTVEFRDDVYRRDPQLLDALNRRGPIRIAYKADPSTAPEERLAPAETTVPIPLERKAPLAARPSGSSASPTRR